MEKILLACVCLCLALAGSGRSLGAPNDPDAPAASDPGMQREASAAMRDLREKYAQTGEGSADEAARIERGVGQVLRLWRASDGDAAAFGGFVRSEFLPRGATLDGTFERFEMALERVGGYLTSLERDLRCGDRPTSTSARSSPSTIDWQPTRPVPTCRTTCSTTRSHSSRC
jgi:hypothetical protein